MRPRTHFLQTVAPPCEKEHEQGWTRQFSLRGVRSGICHILTNGQEAITQVKPENQAEVFGFFLIILFIYLFIFGCAGSSLLCWLFCSCSERELLFVAVPRILIEGASLVVEHRL